MLGYKEDIFSILNIDIFQISDDSSDKVIAWYMSLLQTKKNIENHT